MWDDPTLTNDDKQCIKSFAEVVEEKIKLYGVKYELKFLDICEQIHLDASLLNKEGTLMYALWVSLLDVLKKYMSPADQKYPKIEDFMNAYAGWFTQESDHEKIILWQSANWMATLFKLISARKNKGLALQVIPKLLEGWDVKYVTGSGQTKSTANRVHIFEVEGNTKANHRGKGKLKPNQVQSSTIPRRKQAQHEYISDESPMIPMGKKRKSNDNHMSQGGNDPQKYNYLNPRINDVSTAQQKYHSLPFQKSDDSFRSGFTDGDLSTVHISNMENHQSKPLGRDVLSSLQYNASILNGKVRNDSIPPPPLQRDPSNASNISDPFNFFISHHVKGTTPIIHRSKHVSKPTNQQSFTNSVVPFSLQLQSDTSGSTVGTAPPPPPPVAIPPMRESSMKYLGNMKTSTENNGIDTMAMKGNLKRGISTDPLNFITPPELGRAPSWIDQTADVTSAPANMVPSSYFRDISIDMDPDIFNSLFPGDFCPAQTLAAFKNASHIASELNNSVSTDSAQVAVENQDRKDMLYNENQNTFGKKDLKNIISQYGSLETSNFDNNYRNTVTSSNVLSKEKIDDFFRGF